MKQMAESIPRKMQQNSIKSHKILHLTEALKSTLDLSDQITNWKTLKWARHEAN